MEGMTGGADGGEMGRGGGGGGGRQPDHLSLAHMSRVQRAFYWVGRTCAGNPGRVFAVCAFMSLVLVLGVLNVVIETSPQAIWVPPASTTSREKAYFDEHFKPFFRIEQIYFLPKAPGVDVITPPYLHAALALQKRIENGVILHKAPGQYWLMKHPTLANDPSVALTTACHTTEPSLAARSPCLDQIGTPVMPTVVFGGLGSNIQVQSPDPCGGHVPAAGALVLTLLLNNLNDEAYVNKAKAWEEGVFLTEAQAAETLLANDLQTPMTLHYLSERSIEDSLSFETRQNTWVVLVSYLCMLIYISLALGRCPDRVRSRFLLGVLGIVIVVASLASSLGFWAYVGLHTTLIVWEVVPFLILAIGVDNMFIISREFDCLHACPPSRPPSVPALDTTTAGQTFFTTYTRLSSLPPSNPPSPLISPGGTCGSIDEDLGHALAHVGPSILAASTAETVAFLVGALTHIPALQQFCLVAALAVILDFILQCTWFVAGLALDAKRQEEGRMDGLPCVVVREGGPEDEEDGRGCGMWSGPYLCSRAARRPLIPTVDKQRNGDGDEDDDRRRQYRDATSCLSRILDRYYLPCLFSRAGKTLVLFLAGALFILGFWGLTSLELGLEPQLAAPSDFYLVDYYNTEFSLGEAGPPAYLVLKDLDYADPIVRNAIRNVSTQLAHLQGYVQTPIYSWLDAVDAYLGNENLPPDCPKPDPAKGFYVNAKIFLSIKIETQCCQTAGICGEQYQMDVIFGGGGRTEGKKEGEQSGAGSGPRNGRRSSSSNRNNHTQHGSRRITLEGDEAEEVVVASRFRMQLQPLRTERDFINSYYYLRKYVQEFADAIPETYPGQRTEGGTSNVAFPYSLYFVYYEQYTYIQGVALTNFCLALAAVFACTALLTGSMAIAGVVIGMVLWIILGVVGVLAVWNKIGSGYGVRINAVSVVNVVMATGLSVEFVVHIAAAFLNYHHPLSGGNSGERSSREVRAKQALSSMGASVFSGITLTKLVGVAVLAVAPSHLFRVYYFRMYTCLIAGGAFVGLAFLPVFLSLYGPLQPRREELRLHDSKDDGEGEGETEKMRRTNVRKKTNKKKENKPAEKKE
ncbi:niemann-pick c1 protein [Nannochloropsis oceanica]